MQAELGFKLAYIALSVWRDERRDRYLKRMSEIEREYYDELKRPEYNSSNPDHLRGDQSRFRSQLTLDNLLLERDNIAELAAKDFQRGE